MAKGNQSVSGEAAAAEAAEPVGEPKGKGRFLFILIPLVLLAAGGGGWVAFSQYGKIAAAAAVLSEDDEAQEELVEYGEFLEVQGIIVNPAETGGQRYLMVNVALESDKGKVLEELEGKEVVVRDQIIKLLSERTVDELADIALRSEIKEELREAVNRILRKGEIQRLYFTQYVLQ